MKKIFIIIALNMLQYLSAQQAFTFPEAVEQGIRTTLLDSIYASGVHADTNKCVFKGDQAKYIESYREMLEEFAGHLKKSGMTYTGQLKVFNRIYFDEDGGIDYFLYKIRDGQLTAEQEKQFGEALKTFVPSYRFPMKANAKFAQCGGATYILGEKNPAK